MVKKILLVSFFLITALLIFSRNALQVHAAGLPEGFTQSLFASNFASRLTAMEFTSDGRLFVNEKSGAVRVVKNGNLLSAPFLTVPAYNSNERGLLGITLDPNFASNGHVYVYWTQNNGGTFRNRVTRFTASSTNPDVAHPGSEEVIIDNIPSETSTHNGGAIHFGPDGKLYIAVGDNWTNANSQNLNTLAGKMLRINPDGSIPSDNPYVGQSGKRGEIWASGLRNPYTFTFQQGTGRMFINDVGNNSWEEINEGQIGANYGWPTCEGNCSVPGFKNPIYAYDHNGPGRAITGAVFYNGDTFPSEFNNDYFYGDYVGNYIKRYDMESGVVTDFATDTPYPVDIKVGPDGALYYLSVETSEIYKIQYQTTTPTPSPSLTPTPIGQAPVAFFTNPAEGLTFKGGDTINFSGLATDFEDGILDSSKLRWEILFHHDTHTHPAMEPITGASEGTFTIPSIGETASNIWYRIHLKATDSNGNAHEITRDILPQKANITLNTNPAGLSLNLDGSPITTPNTFQGVVNIRRNLGAPTTQTLNGQVYNFISWSDGGTSAHDIYTPANDTTYTANYALAPVTELLQNNSFDNTNPSWLNPWKWVTKTGAAGTFSQDNSTSHSGLNSGRANITTSSTDWYLQLQQQNIPLVSGSSYAISFWARSNLSRNIRVAIQQTASPYALYFQQTIAINPTWQKYTVTFNSTINQTNAMLIFNLAQNTGQVWLDDVSFTKPSGATPTPSPTLTPTPTPSPTPTITPTLTPSPTPTLTPTVTPTPEIVNLIQNASFESTGTSWINPWVKVVKTGASATFIQDTTTANAGTRSARINITQPSTDHSIQIQHPNIPLVNGVTYTVTFWGKSSTNRNIKSTIQQTASPYSKYHEQTNAFTTSWKKFTYTFTSRVNQSNSMFIFNFGQSTGQVWVDNISITRQ